jgi:hypothetical protein
VRGSASICAGSQTSTKGITEGSATNNHAVCWALQVAEFARLVEDEDTREAMRIRYKTVLLDQMALDGGFPRELGRTKPYSYSIFNLDVMATLCKSLSVPGKDMCPLRDWRWPRHLQGHGLSFPIFGG